MSTILKALRRLEEDSSIDATVSTPSSGNPDSLPATSPHATDELRNRILAEESAAKAIGTDVLDPAPSKERRRIIAAVAAAGLVGALILGLALRPDSSTPDEASETLAATPTTQSPSSAPLPVTETSPRTPRSANDPPPLAPRAYASPAIAIPTAVPAQQDPPGIGHSEDSPTAGTSVSVAAIPIIGSESSRAPQIAPAAQPPPSATRAASPSPGARPDRTPARLTPNSSIPTLSEESSVAAAAPPGAASRQANSPVADSASSDLAANASTTANSATQPTARPAPTRIERQAEKAPAAVSAAESSARDLTRPPMNASINSPMKATRQPTHEPQAKPTTESSEEPAAATVEEHKARAIPDVAVLRTAWHPSPDRRSARIRLLDTKETLNLKEGDAVGGLVIQEISPTAVIFRSGEIELRLRVGQPGSGS